MIPQRTSSLPQKRIRQKNILAVASGKGGVGKTWFSITLAHAFAKNGLKTLLFDGDLGLANVDIQLGLRPETDLEAYVTGGQLLRDIIIPYKEGNFDIISGRPGSSAIASLSNPAINAMRNDLSVIAQGYDKVIIDLSAGVEPAIRTLAANAGSYIILVNAEPTSMTDAYAFIKLTHQDDPQATFKIVINYAESLAEGKQTFTKILQACKNFLKIEPVLVGIVRKDMKIQESIRRQAPFLSSKNPTKACEDMMALAKNLM